MWYNLGKFILKYRLVLLVVLMVINAIAISLALQVKIGYDFTKAIPDDNPKYQDLMAFKANALISAAIKVEKVSKSSSVRRNK